MRGKEKTIYSGALMRKDEVTPRNIHSHEARATMRRILTQLVAETASRNGIILNQWHRRQINNLQVFTNLSDFFAQDGRYGKKKFSRFERITSRLFSFSILGQSSGESDAGRNYHPAIYISAHPLGGQRMFAPTLLHELQHIADNIVLPPNSKKGKKGQNIELGIDLSLLILFSSAIPELLLLAQDQTTTETNVAFLSTAFLGIVGLLVELKRYSSQSAEKWAETASKRLRD